MSPGSRWLKFTSPCSPDSIRKYDSQQNVHVPVLGNHEHLSYTSMGIKLASGIELTVHLFRGREIYLGDSGEFGRIIRSLKKKADG